MSAITLEIMLTIIAAAISRPISNAQPLFPSPIQKSPFLISPFFVIIRCVFDSVLLKLGYHTIKSVFPYPLEPGRMTKPLD